MRVNIDIKVVEAIEQYCTYAGFRKADDFFEEAALHILNKDKAFKDWKDSQKATT